MSLFNSSNAKIVQQAQEWFNDARKDQQSWRREALESYGFYAGEQWSTEDAEFLRDQNRPIVTFNRIQPMIDAVTGAERNNRQEVRFLPRTLDDGNVGEMFTAVGRWIRDKTDAEDEESESFLDCLITGMGWTETWIDFESELDGEIRIDRVPPLEMFWDSDARKRNLSDAKWCMRIKLMTREEIKEIWPDKRIVTDGAFDAPQITKDPHDADNAKFYLEDQGGRQRQTNELPVAQVQWWERRPVFRVMNPFNNQLEVLTREEVDSVEEQLGEELPKVRQTRKEFFQAFIVGKTLLDKQPLHESDDVGIVPGFTLRAITGKRDEEERAWFGLIRAMKDPQQWSNKFFSQMLEIINSNAKGGILAEKGAFDNVRKAEENWSSPDKIVWLNDGALQNKRVEVRPSANMPAGLGDMLAFSVDATRQASGINIEFLGQAARTQSGVVERTRIEQSLLTLSIFFDSLRRYRKEQGRVMLHFIHTYLPNQMIVRVVGEDRFVEFDRKEADDITRFDIIVDQSPTSPNAKQEAWEGFQQILPAMVKAGLPVPPEVLDFAPLPASVIAKMKKFYASQGPSEEEQELQLRGATAEVEKSEAEVQSEKMEALEKFASAFSNFAARENDQEKTQIDKQRASIDALEVILDAIKEDFKGNVQLETAVKKASQSSNSS